MKAYWIEKDGRQGYCFHVYYKAKPNGRRPWHGRRRDFSSDDNLPNTVLEFLLNAPVVNTIYDRNGWVYKREIYKGI